MPNVELVWDHDCPHVAEARANLCAAFAALGIPARWSEWDRADPAAPPHARSFGSPAILIDGRDVAGLQPQEEACCRVYDASGRIAPAPPVEVIASALRAAGVASAPGPSSAERSDDLERVAGPAIVGRAVVRGVRPGSDRGPRRRSVRWRR